MSVSDSLLCDLTACFDTSSIGHAPANAALDPRASGQSGWFNISHILDIYHSGCGTEHASFELRSHGFLQGTVSQVVQRRLETVLEFVDSYLQVANAAARAPTLSTNMKQVLRSSSATIGRKIYTIRLSTSNGYLRWFRKAIQFALVWYYSTYVDPLLEFAVGKIPAPSPAQLEILDKLRQLMDPSLPPPNSALVAHTLGQLVVEKVLGRFVDTILGRAIVATFGWSPKKGKVAGATKFTPALVGALYGMRVVAYYDNRRR